MSLFPGGRPGPAWGGLLAGSFAFFLALALLVHASARLLFGDSAALPLSGTTVVRLSAAYLGGGLVAGALFHRLLPHATRKEEGVAIGFASALPFLAAIRIAVEGVADWSMGDVLRVVGLSLLVGLYAGASAWRPNTPSGSAGRSR